MTPPTATTCHSWRMKIDRENRNAAVYRVLHQEQFVDVDDVQSLAGGFFSQAYAFSSGGGEYVVRINSAAHAAESFAKDDYAWRHFASDALPIPRIVAVGEMPGGHYAISERAPGRTLSDCTDAECNAASAAVYDTLEEIGKADASASQGYGPWGSDGNGQFESWQAYLAGVIENHADGYYEDWHRLFEDSFLERDLYENVYAKMLRLTVDVPNERSLIHYDYQFENIIIDNGQVTGVIDWANALYGDHLYDVAWLNWLSVHPGWWYPGGVEILRQRFGEAAGYGTRIKCYELNIGLDHLRFYAKNDRYDDYQICRDWLLARMSAEA
jgi:hygromycin-B 4-O-kinase